MPALRKHGDLVAGRPKAILAFWAIFSLCFAIFAPQLLAETTQAFSPPPDSQAAKATKRLEQLFPETARSTQFVVLIQANDLGSTESVVDLDATKTVSNSLEQHALDQALTISVAGYVALQKRGLGQEALNPFVSDDKTSTLIQLNVQAYMTSSDGADYLDWLEKEVRSLRDGPSGEGGRGGVVNQGGAVGCAQAGVRRQRCAPGTAQGRVNGPRASDTRRGRWRVPASKIHGREPGARKATAVP